jgi:hypothetical protein
MPEYFEDTTPIPVKDLVESSQDGESVAELVAFPPERMGEEEVPARFKSPGKFVICIGNPSNTFLGEGRYVQLSVSEAARVLGKTLDLASPFSRA